MGINFKTIYPDAAAKVNSLASSVLVLSRLAKVSPDVLAAGLVDEEANGDYYVALTNSLANAMLAKAKKEEKEAKAKKA